MSPVGYRLPHFHAVYGEFEAIIEITSGRIMEGRLPPKAKKLVEEWRRKNLKDISTAWTAASLLKLPKKIRGLE